MPLRNGRLTQMERGFVKHMAATGDKTYAAWKAGYSSPETQGCRIMQNEIIRDNVKAEQMRRLKSEGVEAATDALISNARDRTIPANSRNQASIAIWNIVQKDDDTAGPAKDLSEMSLAEITMERRRLEMRIALLEGRSEGVEEAETLPIEEPKGDVFG
jgi:hypothetical protein